MTQLSDQELRRMGAYDELVEAALENEGCGRKIGIFNCCTVVEGNSIRLLQELTGPGLVLVTDPPYNVDFAGKSSKTKPLEGGYIGEDSDIGIDVVALALRFCTRGAIFPGTRAMFRYPEPYDVGCVYCPSGAGLGRWG